jgi:hypothetical protein
MDEGIPLVALFANVPYFFPILHTADTPKVNFIAQRLNAWEEGITDESWSLDNVRVEANLPEPLTILLLGAGLLGLGWITWRWRRK